MTGISHNRLDGVLDSDNEKHVAADDGVFVTIHLAGVAVRLDATDLRLHALRALRELAGETPGVPLKSEVTSKGGPRSGDVVSRGVHTYIAWKSSGAGAPQEAAQPLGGAQRIVDLDDIIEHESQRALSKKMPNSAADYFASLGPWVTGRAVKDSLKVSWETLGAWRREHRLLGVEFADGKYYYPRQQFRNGMPNPSLPQILEILEPAYVAPEAMLAWLAGEAYEGETATRWELLHLGDIETLAGWARDDAAQIINGNEGAQ